MPTKPKQYSLKWKFRKWLLIQYKISNQEFSDLDSEMKTERAAINLETIPSTCSEVRKFAVDSLPPETINALARLGLAYKAYERAFIRKNKVACGIKGFSPELEELYDEFRKADDWYEQSHKDMLKGLIEGLENEI